MINKDRYDSNSLRYGLSSILLIPDYAVSHSHCKEYRQYRDEQDATYINLDSVLTIIESQQNPKVDVYKSIKVHVGYFRLE